MADVSVVRVVREGVDRYIATVDADNNWAIEKGQMSPELKEVELFSLPGGAMGGKCGRGATRI